MKDKREVLIDSAVGSLAAVMSAANPILGIVGNAFAPALANAVRSFLPKALGEREQQRVEIVFIRSIEKIRLMLDNGKCLEMTNPIMVLHLWVFPRHRRY